MTESRDIRDEINDAAADLHLINLRFGANSFQSKRAYERLYSLEAIRDAKAAADNGEPPKSPDR